MQFNIDVRPTADGWEVSVKDIGTGQPVLKPETGQPFIRALRRVGEDLNVFPQPPREEADAIPDDDRHPHRDLCTTNDPKMLRAAFRDIIARKPDGVVRFGRYLFATLLGDALWNLLNNLAADEPLELALSWQKDDVFINRLPWEMMSGAEHFLAEELQVAITRRVASVTTEFSEIASPRVLFVVGSDLGSDEIRPGAEYLGLLRSLRNAHGLLLKTHLLLRASPKRLRAAIKWFRPTVIHFICHGQANDKGEIFLKLMKDDNSGGAELVGAETLFGLLRPEPDLALPQIVVLNACYTASEKPDVYLKAGQAASPMAVRLVEGDARGGVPIVVGMAGQVSDQACRLFTRCFYLSLLDGKEIAQATAAGRRLGIIGEGLTNPKTSVDWAMPTLFLSEGVREPRLRITLPPVEIDLHKVAAKFSPPAFPVFCDRLDLFDLYDQLMSNYDALLDDAVGMPLQRGVGEMQAIAVYVSKKMSETQHGRTWLLHELAARAVLDGHVPCIVNIEWINREKDNYPKTFARLIDDLCWAMWETAKHFGLTINPDCSYLLGDVKEGKKDASLLPADVQNVYRRVRDYDHPAVASAAARIDLLRLLEAVRLLRPPGERERCKLLLLIDDVHQMDAAASGLLNHLLGTDGLRSSIAEAQGLPNAHSDVRVVFTYDATLGHGKEEEIKHWIDRHRWVKPYPLKTFQQPLEELLAYQLFLSCWRDENNDTVSITVDQSKQEHVEHFFQKLAKRVEGVPSKLNTVRTAEFISSYLDHSFKVLIKANDEQLLELIDQQRRGGAR